MANTNWRLLLLRATLIIVAGFWVFSPALHGDWLMDDPFYLTQNALLGDPARLWKIWFAPGSLIEYYPLEASLQALQWHLWHEKTLGYHVTNVILHLLGALLVWRLLDKFGLRLAWLGGLLFAVHPAVVESVAWIAEFKNVLSLPPFLLSMCCWIDYEEHRRPRDYALALALFLVAMLCKISMALFPFVILLYAWWKRGRIGRHDLMAATPFLLVSLVLGLTTIEVGNWFREAHLQPTDPVPIGGPLARLALAGTSLAFYFFAWAWPVNPLPNYPKWTVDPPSPVEFLPWLILGVVISFCWIKRATWGRHVLLGLGFFLITLAPFIGFNSVTYMKFTWVMDHFLYLPMIGLIGLAIAGLEQIDRRLPPTWMAGILAAVLALLTLESHWYAGMFIGQEDLWTYTLEHNPSAWLARNNLGNVLFSTGRVHEAIEQYQQALRVNPDLVETNNNLGLALNHTGQPAEAISHFERALKVNPHFALAHVNLANTLSQLGRIPEAIDHYEQALKIEPENSEARKQLTRLEALPQTEKARVPTPSP